MLLVIRNPRFRLLWSSSVANFIGLTAYFTVHGWLALEVTDSAFWVGATFGVKGLSIMLFSAAAGVMVDRLNRKTLILASVLFQAGLMASVAALILTEQILLWHILAATLLDGMLTAIKVPARTALVLDVAGRRNMLQATAATNAAMTAAGIAVPPLAGLLVETHGIGWAFLAMSGAFFLSAIVICFLRDVKEAERDYKATPFQDFRDGLHYVLAIPAIRLLFLLMVTSELFGWAHEPMMPVMAGKVLEIGPTGLGYLMSAGSVGALITSLILSAIGDIRRKGLALILGYIGFGAFLIAFAASEWIVMSLILIAIAYASVTLYETMMRTLLQTSVPDEIRGRVLSFQTFSWGFTGVSGFYTGAPIAIGIGGGVVALNGLSLIRSFAGRYNEERGSEISRAS